MWNFEDPENSSLTDPDVLRIQSLFPSPKKHEEIKTIDVTLLSLTQEAWDYSRGARTTRFYKNQSDELVVCHKYEYTMVNDNRDIGAVTHKFQWHQNDNAVGLEKVINKIMTTKSLGQLNQEVRKGRMTDLRENAKLIGRDDITDNLYSWYKDEIYDYEEINSLDFENALKTEADSGRLAVLNESIAQFGGLTVMQLLRWQLVGDYFTWP